MLRLRASEKWIEVGYSLFARYGMDSVQIEKIARILKLNKSGFYHHFGTLEIFLERLVAHHNNNINVLIKDIQESQDIDPDVINTFIRHRVTVMAQVQLTRNKSNPLFSSASESADKKIDRAVLPIWAEHIGVLNNDDVALKYCRFVRDMFYVRISFENFNYSFLHVLATEAKEIVAEMLKGRIPNKKD